MKHIIFWLLFSIVLLVSLTQCHLGKAKMVNIDINKPALEKLSDYHFFSGELKNLYPNEGIVPYELINPLFSDYAQKLRFIYVPQGQVVNYNDTAVLDFPVGSCIIKNFFYFIDERDTAKGRKIMETRILIHHQDHWEAYPYIWNEEQTEAFLQVAGGDKQVEWINKAGEKMIINYSIPNKNQCKSCHWNHEKFTPIGPKVSNLNADVVYADGKRRNQLDKWAALGILKGLKCPATSPRMEKWDDTTALLQDRALAYLDVNCAHCHSSGGQAATSGLILSYGEHNPTKLGVLKSPVAAGIGSGGRLYDIVPGEPDSSIIYFRMNSVNPGIMMPELGRHVIHKEGVALIYQWIKTMDKKNPIVFAEDKTACTLKAN